MHELSIAVAVVEEIETIVRREGALSVRSVVLRVGRLSGVEPQALELAFPLAAEGTLLQAAQLTIEETAARMHCAGCGAVTEPRFPCFVCELCGSSKVDVKGGDELLIQSVELNLPDGSD